MIVRVGLAPRLPGATLADFQAEWSGEHAEVAARLPGLRGYVQNHAVADGGPALPHPGFDVCAEMEFDDLAAMDAAVGSPHYAEQIAAVGSRTIDMSRVVAIAAERQVAIAGEPGPDAVKLMTFLRAGEDGAEALREAVVGPWREALAEAAPLRHELLLGLPERDGAPFGAIDVLWLPSVSRALETATGPACERARIAVGPAAASERLIARPRVIFEGASA